MIKVSQLIMLSVRPEIIFSTFVLFYFNKSYFIYSGCLLSDLDIAYYISYYVGLSTNDSINILSWIIQSLILVYSYPGINLYSKSNRGIILTFLNVFNKLVSTSSVEFFNSVSLKSK